MSDYVGVAASPKLRILTITPEAPIWGQVFDEEHDPAEHGLLIDNLDEGLIVYGTLPDIQDVALRIISDVVEAVRNAGQATSAVTLYTVVFTDPNGSINSAHLTRQDAEVAGARLAMKQYRSYVGVPLVPEEGESNTDIIDRLRNFDGVHIEIERIVLDEPILSALAAITQR